MQRTLTPMQIRPKLREAGFTREQEEVLTELLCPSYEETLSRKEMEILKLKFTYR